MLIRRTLIFLFLIFSYSVSSGQDIGKKKEGSEQVLLDNDKMKVVKYVGTPQGQVCGKGMHYHEAHLTVALADAKAVITSPDGKSNEVEIPAEAAIWFDAGSHSAVNSGKSETKFLLIYLKE